MSYSKAEIYNLALSHLLLNRQIVDTETDNSSKEIKALNTHWNTALNTVLQELDLDGLSSFQTLELLETLSEGPWTYVYKYPSNCAHLRRIDSGVRVDNRFTHIKKRIAIKDGVKVIYTNEANASVEFIPKDFSLTLISAPAALALSYFLAWATAPLIVGKGGRRLKEKIYADYVIAKEAAQGADARENENYNEYQEESEFVNVRLS